jgi:sterol desaturase/sphingolipid hydroxylase (fatty acid hydroxylase superfamily)
MTEPNNNATRSDDSASERERERREQLKAAEALRKLNQLTESSGELRWGTGMITGIIALSLAILCFLGVMAFHFPTYLTTPELRKAYNVDVLRQVMLWSLVIAGGLALRNIIFSRARWLSAAAFALVTITALLGGHKVEVGDFPESRFYIGLDWFILDLLGSTLIFIFIEKLFPLKKNQPVFREEWQTDFHHFIVNHLIVGFVLLAANQLVHGGFSWAVSTTVQTWIQGLPFLIELFLIILVADLVQYWTHRAYHEVSLLWRLHAVHHSAKSMDWLAGSRQHVIELVLTRTLVLAPIFVLGFSKSVIDAYIIIVGFQAVFNHCNVDIRLGPLRYLIVTPNFHHWHHSQDKEALDRNYAAHFAFIDYIFGTAVNAERKWPAQYGVLGDYVPNGFLKQVAFPFTWNDKAPPPPPDAPLTADSPTKS